MSPGWLYLGQVEYFSSHVNMKKNSPGLLVKFGFGTKLLQSTHARVGAFILISVNITPGWRIYMRNFDSAGEISPRWLKSHLIVVGWGSQTVVGHGEMTTCCYQKMELSIKTFCSGTIEYINCPLIIKRGLSWDQF